ncbi:MAG TPA: methyltransferase domain-containing protein [Actinomycetota bacterium]|nr:methyltransferase domain-containing protein [Actinomycetota bacterium]
MATDDRFLSDRFPLASRYHPDWVLDSAGGGANSLWITEWLASAMSLQPGMRVLDLGCGRAASSIFLHREFGVQVWATDLWVSASENLKRISDAGAAGAVFPIHADARSLPFAGDFFDAIVSIDSFPYFGTDELYLNYLAHFVKPAGLIGMAGAGLVKEFEGAVPPHLLGFWGQDCWALHSAAWWRSHWEKTGIVAIEHAGAMPEGWRVWLDWHKTGFPENEAEITTLETDAGEYLGYVRVVGRRNGGVQLEEYCWPDTLRVSPEDYHHSPLLREPEET